MTIEIVGASEGSERDAAEQLKLILSPLVRNNRLTIVVGAKCLGEPVQDIDLLLLGSFGLGIKYKSTLQDREINLVNLCLVIEVKDHSSSRLKFDSQHVLVRYSNKEFWSDATEQLQNQRNSLRNFLVRNRLEAPWIEGLLWLRNYGGDIPPAAQNVLGAGLTLENFMEALERLRPPREGEGCPYIAFTKNANVRAIQNATDYFRKEIPQTPLDRRRLEQICKKLVADQKYAEALGKQLLIFRGRGGSGKTIHLLRVAKGLYDRGERVLFLTYNKALVADIRRLLTLQGLLAQSMDRGIHIVTAHKYFFSVLSAFGLWNPPSDDTFPAIPYEMAKRDLVDLLSDETPATLRAQTFVQNAPEEFNWDYVLIDEGQDWPENERDIVFKVFGPDRCIVADGVDQLARQQEVCDWTGSRHVRQRQTVGLSRSMRMKANLCRFARAFAQELDLEWEQEVNEEITGGRVTVIDGNYSLPIHESIFKDHASTGNLPIDALICVAPGAQHSTAVVQRLESWGFSVWDGTQSENRDIFPTDNEQFRVVRYESCRGLEGWTVVCHDFDRFYVHRLNYAERRPTGQLFSDEEYAKLQANQWLLIPLTRSIDHLVLHITGDSEVARILRKLRGEYSDFVDWIDATDRA